MAKPTKPAAKKVAPAKSAAAAKKTTPTKKASAPKKRPATTKKVWEYIKKSDTGSRDKRPIVD